MAIHHIDREHPEYVSNRVMWKRYRDLYAGGEQLRANAAEYLVRRNKEPAEVYFERLSRVFYENYSGSIIDWYTATLMRREPVLQFDGSDAGKGFFNGFVQNCDLRGTTLTQFFRQRLTQALVCGRSYIAVDFPRIAVDVNSRAEEDALGRSKAYLVEYSPDEIINWSYDSTGTLEWVVIRTSSLRQETIQDEEWKQEKRWIYYDRERFQIYRERTRPSGQAAAIELLDEGTHGLAGGFRRDPILPQQGGLARDRPVGRKLPRPDPGPQHRGKLGRDCQHVGGPGTPGESLNDP